MAPHEAEEFPLVVQDYNKRVENMVQTFREKCATFSKMIATRCAVELSQLSAEQKNITVSEMLNANLNSQETKEDEMDSSNILEDSVMSVIGKFNKMRGEGPSTSKKSCRKPASRTVAAETPGTVVRTGRSTRKRMLDEGPATSTANKKTAPPLIPCTPVNPVLPNQMMTPMITPKFNIATPLPLTVCRQPKQNEMTVSLNGSPVCLTTRKTTKSKKNKEPDFDFATITGGKFTLQLPVTDNIDVAGLDLDDEHYEKLANLQKGITTLLKMRQNSTTSDSE